MAFPDPTNVTTFSGYLQYANIVAEQQYGNILLISIFLIFFIATKVRFENIQAFAFASFVAAISAIYLRWLGVVGDFAMFLSIIAVIVAALGLYLSGVNK
jgi:hypothetical protein